MLSSHMFICVVIRPLYFNERQDRGMPSIQKVAPDHQVQTFKLLGLLLQVVTTVHASDETTDLTVLAVNTASAALALSPLPWEGPIGCVRVRTQS